MRTTLLAAAALMLCAAPLATMAQDKKPEVKKPTVKAKHGSWEVLCQGENCLMQQVFKDEQGRPVMVMMIEKLKEAKKVDAGEIVAQARIVTPLQVVLLKGLGIKIDDGEPTRRPYFLCNIQGCVVQTPIFAAEVDKMKSGSKLELITELPGAKGPQSLPVPLSLEGFAKAYGEF